MSPRAHTALAALALALTAHARPARAQDAPGSSARLVVRTPQPARVAALVGAEPVALPVVCAHQCVLAVPPGRVALGVDGPRGPFRTRVFDVPPSGAVARLRIGSRREGAAAAWFIASAVALLGSLPLIGIGSACTGADCSSAWVLTAGWSGIVLFGASFPLLVGGVVEAARLGDGLTYVEPVPRAAVATYGARF